MTPEAISALIDGTWPAAAYHSRGPWMIREGRGAGSRVSAATAKAPDALDKIELAETAMRELDQTPIFMVREGEEALDSALAGRGYRIKDPVTFYHAPVGVLATQRPPPVTTFETWPMLATQKEIWRAGGMDDVRFDVMYRVTGPKTTILGRLDDTPAGALFVAMEGGCAVLHGIETLKRFRRRGLAAHIMRAAAFWARDNGATKIALLTTQANIAANALYSSIGMIAAAGYHYRIHPEA